LHMSRLDVWVWMGQPYEDLILRSTQRAKPATHYTHPEDCQARHKLTFVVERDALTQTVCSGDGYVPGIQTLDGAPPAL
jgi:hypothetical protein